jgi:signal transduction histidine kinase
MRPLHPRIYTHLVTLWLALSVGGIVLGIVVWQRLNESLDGSLRGASFRIALQEVQVALIESETHARAYCLVRTPEALREFDVASARFPVAFGRLAELSLPNAQLRQEVLDLQAAGTLHLNALGRQMELARAGLTSGPEVERVIKEADEMGTRMRERIRQLEAYPEGLLAKHSDAARSELQRALSTTLAAGLFGLGAGVLAFYLSRVALRQEKQKRELSEHALRAERAAQDKTTFLANMSHEIRTPMNAILGFSELLIAELPNGGRSRLHAKSIHEAAQSLLQLINDILDLSKLEASMLELHLDPADVREMSSFLQTVFAQQAARKGLRLNFSVDPELPHALLVDRSRLRQVLVNLVGNAIKFTEKGSVTVRILWELNAEVRSSGTLIFEVSDTGIGIPPEKQAQIFEPFVQVDARRQVEQQGTGLGLSIVQRLTERMGGSVDVQSTVGFGSTFRIRLPEVEISARLPTQSGLGGAEVVDFNELAPADILVVDDNAANRNLLGSNFDGTHHRVRFATNGREAVESVRTSKPDIVLMDIRMPEMDGQTALSEIRKLPGAEVLPVIAVTASSMVEDEHRLRGLFAGYLRKPFTRRMLFRKMSYFLPRQNAAIAEGAPAVALPSSPVASPEKWAGLAATLRKLEQSEWPAVRDGGVISEIKQFAEKLQHLAATRGCPALAHYASVLVKDADAYAVQRVEEKLAGFPALISEIEKAAQAPAAASPS